MEKRLPGEEIRDARIIQIAHSGDLMQAIRLYRTKNQVGLLDGKLGVEASTVPPSSSFAYGL